MRVFSAMIAAAAAWAFAAAHAFTMGPPVGAAIPHQLAAADQNGAAQSFAKVVGKNGVVVAFSRSADWCPICQKQLIELNAALPELAKRGYTLVSVTTDTPEKLDKFVKMQAVRAADPKSGAKPISFTMLADPDKKIIDAFNLRDPSFPPGNRIHGVPTPALFIVKANGAIAGKLGDANYRVRPSTDELLKAIDAAG